MVHRKIMDIDLPRFIWNKLSKTKKVYPNMAFDTETINGRCFLISDSEGNYKNDKEFIDLKGLLEYLNQKKYRTTNNWFYNLEYDTNAILHFLTFEERQFIASFNYVDYDKYRISIIPKKELKISVLQDNKLLHTTAFYDLAQFYNFKKLEILAKDTIHNKVYVSDISQINKDKYYSNTEYFNLINNRCIIDCKIAVIKADELTNNINKIVRINKYRSKASIARRYVLENITHNLKLPSNKMLDAALKSYHAGHIETCKIGLFNNIHNYDIKCFDTETELLTEKGFKKWNKFTKDDKVGTLNLDNGYIEYQDILHIHKYQYNGNLINMKNTNMDIMVTPNHRMYYQVHNRCKHAKNLDEYNTWSDFKCSMMEDMPNGNIRIPTMGIYNSGKKSDIDINMIKLCAWVITEGHFIKKGIGVVILQSDKYGYQNEIRDILNNLNIDYKETNRGLRKSKNFNSYEFYIHKPNNINLRNLLNNKKEIPENWVNDWNKESLEIFFWQLMKGDGSFRCHKNKMEFKSYNDHDLNMMQQICFKIGLRSSINYKHHAVHINKNRDGTFSTIQYQKKELVPYNDWVWCVTTQNDTVVVRRNGKIFITGNSAYPSFIAELYETNGKYLHNTEYEPDTAYSFYLVKIDYDNDYLSPLWFLKSSNNYHITGKVQTWITQPEIEYFMANGYDLQIIKAYHIKKTRHTEKPFYNIIHDLYKERLKAKDNKDEIELVYKVILNSIYGVTLNTIHKKELSDIETDEFEIQNHKVLFYQSTYKATNMYNPVFGTYITAGTRAKLFTDFNKKLNQIVSVNTDGVYMHSKSDNIPISSELGDYGYKHYQKMMFMGSGRYFIFDENILSTLYDNTVVDNGDSRFRSVPKQSSDIYNMMQKNKDDSTISIIKDKPIKLKESVKNSNYYNLTFSSFPVQDFTLYDQFNVFNAVRKDISFYNTRRYWYNEIDRISDLWDNTFESRPFKINEVAQQK